MNPAFVSHEGNRDQNQDHNQDHALFVFREFKYSEQAFHALAAQLVITLPFSMCHTYPVKPLSC